MIRRSDEEVPQELAATDEARRAEVGSADEAIARLLELSGRRDEPEPARLMRIREAVEPHWRRRVRRRRRVAVTTGTAIAALVLVALLPNVRSRLGAWLGGIPKERDLVASVQAVAGAGPRRGGGGEPGAPLAPGARLYVGQTVSSGESRVAFRLGEGVQARLDRRSSIRFVGRERIELQRGAVYVDTGRTSPERGALEVVTPRGVVEDVGTRFEVRLQNGENGEVAGNGDTGALRLLIRDGAVVLHHGRGSYEGRAGEELRLGVEGTVDRRAVSASDPRWEWTLEVSAAPDFDGAPLTDILDWGAREMGRALRFADADAERLARRATVRGDVEGLPVLDALRVVLPVSGLAHRLEAEALVVESAGGGGERR